LTRCGMECIDTRIEPNHCGTCTNVCASGMCQNGACLDPQICGEDVCIDDDPPCLTIRCGLHQQCINGECFCSAGRVNCDQDRTCESCGRCGVTSCPVDPATGRAGSCCPGGFCSCGGSCEASCKDCWLTPTGQDREGTPTGYREQCGSPDGCVDCWGRCCTACINGECASSGPIGGGSIRRR
jgi:hypothetical protein